MAKIKNWSRSDENWSHVNGVKAAWQHDKTGDFVKVESVEGEKNLMGADVFYVVTVPGKILGRTTKLENGKDAAKEWMQKHPTY